MIKKTLALTCGLTFLFSTCSTAQVLKNVPFLTGLKNVNHFNYSEQHNKYVAVGSFNGLTQKSNQSMIVDSTGVADFLNPVSTGQIYTKVSDGNGGFFFGGEFDDFFTVKRGSLVHVLPNGQVSGFSFDFKRNVTETGKIIKLLLVGDLLFVGGDFTEVNGVKRKNFAAINIVSNTLTNHIFNVQTPVFDICSNSLTNEVFVVGEFQEVNGVVRKNIFSFQATETILSNFNFNITNTSTPIIHACEVLNNNLYLGFGELYINSAYRKGLGVINLSNNSLDSYQLPATYTELLDLEVSGDSLAFLHTSSSSIQSCSFLNVASGTISNLPITNAPYFLPSNLYSEDDQLIVSNGITNRFYIVKNEGGTPTINALNVEGDYYNLFPYAANYILSGTQKYMKYDNAVNYLAVFDEETKQLESWCENVHFTVFNIGTPYLNVSYILGDTLIVGGYFDQVNGYPRNGIAAFNLITGELLDFTISNGFDIQQIAYHDSKLVLYGQFKEYNPGGWYDYPSQLRFANINNAQVTESYPIYEMGPINQVLDLLIYGDSLFLSGMFVDILGITNNHFAVLDLQTLMPLPSFLSFDQLVKRLDLFGETLYCEGDFYSVNGETRGSVCSYDLATNQLTSIGNALNESIVELNGLFIQGATDYEVFDTSSMTVVSSFPRVYQIFDFHSYFHSNSGVPRIDVVGEYAISMGTISEAYTVKCADTTTIQVTNAICSYTLNGETYAQNGTYYQTFQTAAGCDSTLAIQLTLANSVDTIYPTGFLYVNVNGINYTRYASTGVQHFTNIYGCDSTLYIYANIADGAFFDTVTAYNSYYWQAPASYGGTSQLITESGFYSVPYFWLNQSGYLCLQVEIIQNSTVTDSSWISNGEIYTLFDDTLSNSVFVNGSFNYVGPNNPRSAFFNTSDFNHIQNSPIFNGTIYASVGDGDGGFFIGGEFTKVNNIDRKYIVHLDSNLEVTNWNPSFNNHVLALELKNNNLYVGGSFTSVNGQLNVNKLVRLNKTTGEILSTYGSLGSEITRIQFMNDTIATFSQSAVSFYNSLTGNFLTGIGFSGISSLTSFAITSDGIYIAGSNMPSPYTRFRAYNRSDLSLKASQPTFTITPSNAFMSLNVSNIGDTMVCYGSFLTVNGQAKSYLAAFYNDELLPIDFGSNGTILFAFSDESEIQLYSSQTQFYGQPSTNNVALKRSDLSVSALPDFKMNSLGTLETYAKSGTKRFFGGGFLTYGGKKRSGFAQLDKNTLKFSDLQLNLGNTGGQPSKINAIERKGDTLILAGSFTSINGVSRSNLAFFDLNTNTLLPSTLEVSATIYTILKNGDELLISGSFQTVSGVSRQRLASINLSNLSLNAWNPSSNGYVYSMEKLQNKVLLGGSFTTIDGQQRNRFAQMDLTSKTLLADLISFDNSVNDILIQDTNIFIGGRFLSCNGTSQQYMARFHTSDLSLTPWSANVNGEVRELDYFDGYLYYTGEFTNINGKERLKYGASLIAEGITSNWYPSSGLTVNDILPTENGVFIGGEFDKVNGMESPNLAFLGLPEAQVVYDTIQSCTPYLWIDGITYSDSISDVHYIPSSFSQMDEVHHLNFTPISDNLENEVVYSCGAYLWPESNLTYTFSGTYTKNYTNAEGCESTKTLDLIILGESQDYYESVISCENTYVWNATGQSYVNSGNYTHTLQSQFGCDSILHLNLIFDQLEIDTIVIHGECTFYWGFNNQFYTETGIYADSIILSSGCQVVKYLDFEKAPVLYDTLFVNTYCDYYLWDRTNETFFVSGIYTFQNPNLDCDVVDVLVLNILGPYDDTTTVNSCEPYFWTSSGITYNESGIYSQTFTTVLGCDSTVTLNLQMNTPFTDTLFVESCSNYTWSKTNVEYEVSGIYDFVVAGTNACDSIFVLNLTVNQVFRDTLIVDTCLTSYTWTENGQLYSNGGIYEQVYTSINGCDSTYVLNLSLTEIQTLEVQNFSVPAQVDVCNGALIGSITGNSPFSILVNSSISVQTDSLYNIASLCAGIVDFMVDDQCGNSSSFTFVVPDDSSYIFTNPFIDSLIIDSLGNTITNCTIFYDGIDTIYIDTIWMNGLNATVVWNIVDVNGIHQDTAVYALLNGAGVYYLQITLYCIQKSTPGYYGGGQTIYFGGGNDVQILDLDELTSHSIQVYPNPFEDEITVKTDFNSPSIYQIYESKGKLILKGNLEKSTQIQLKQLESGMYYLYVLNEKGRYMKKIIKH